MHEAGRTQRPLAETLVVLGLITLATVAIAWGGRSTPLDAYVHVIVGVLFLVSALQLAQRSPDGLSRYGLALGGLMEPPQNAEPGVLASLLDLLSALRRALPSALRELGYAARIVALVFPPFVIGFFLWHRPEHAFELQLPVDLPAYVMTQLLVVALPEEALFRGYAQTRLHDAFGDRVRVLGVTLSLRALLVQAALFGLMHFAVEPYPARLAVFFPALLFGWVRQARGGIGAAVILHAASNLLGDVLARGWL
jgi:membrane protease YdiL (CAAX protease family)